MDVSTVFATERRFDPRFLTQNAKLRRELERAYLLARSDIPLLILGETGVGKSWLTRDLHHLSGRTGHLQTVECPSLAENIVESEIFGHVRGAFTGASRDRTGLVEIAEKGTLFLDELGDLSTGVQAKLLRAVQDGVIRRVGDTKDVKVDIRWFCATNVNLTARIQAGEFRNDLYFRLAQGTITITPLRERPEDVPLLIREFFRRKSLVQDEVLSRDALSALTAYAWPGNVRELFAVLQVGLAIRDGSLIEPRHLQFRPELLFGGAVDENDPGIRVGQTLAEAKKRHVLATMRKSRTRTAAAAMLNVGLGTLNSWLRKWEQA